VVTISRNVTDSVSLMSQFVVRSIRIVNLDFGGRVTCFFFWSFRPKVQWTYNITLCRLCAISSISQEPLNEDAFF